MNIINSKIYVCNKELYGQGKSLNLIHYPCIDSFKKECSRLFVQHQEFIYFDYENIPEVYVSERWISPNYFSLIRAVARLDENRQEAFSAWLDCNRPDLGEKEPEDIIRIFLFCYEGIFQDPLLFACKYAKDQLNITKWNSPLFDFDGYKNELFSDLFQFVNGGYVFKKISIN